MVGDKMICEDIVQSVFLRFYENLDSIKTKESIKYWLYTTTRNMIYEHYRHKKIHTDKYNAADSEEIEMDAGIDISKLYEQKELKQIIMDELDNMPEEQREVFLLKEYGQLSYKEISDLLSIDINLVKSRLFKVRQKIIKRTAKRI